uniref:Alternative protein NXF2B n=1 Tax=Homo sapiens TaxID=9606 RepID=L8E7H1_HUMAN|nr:alternative protein NXF2B [Homo sapiens]
MTSAPSWWTCGARRKGCSAFLSMGFSRKWKDSLRVLFSPSPGPSLLPLAAVPVCAS